MTFRFSLLYSCSVLSLLVAACRVSTPKPKQELVLPYYTTPDFAPKWVSETEADTLHSIPDFSFTNQLGQTVTRDNFNGKITVVDFFFTSCPGICRKLTDHMIQIQEIFKNDNRVMLLSHSVTPDKDDVSVLATYAKLNGAIPGKWHFVTGDKASIYAIARKSYFADEDMGEQKDSTTFLHTENILLIDSHHHIRGVYKGTVDLEIKSLIADIKKLEEEK